MPTPHFSGDGSMCVSAMRWSRSRCSGIAVSVCFSCPVSAYRTTMTRANILADAADFSAARPYPERAEEQSGWHDRAAEFLFAAMIAPVSDRLRNSRYRLQKIVELTDRHERYFQAALDEDLVRRAQGMRARLRRDGFAPELVGECFALVRGDRQSTP